MNTNISNRRIIYTPALASGGGGSDPFALDGTFKDDTGTASSWNTTGYTSAFGNLVVYIAIETNGGPVLSVTGGGITFSKRASIANIELWAGTSVTPLASQAFAITTTSNAFYHSLVFAFSGGKMSAPYDPNTGAIPATFNSSTVPTWTTSNANDILIGAAAGNSGAAATAPWINLMHGNFMTVAYQIVSLTQAGSTLVYSDASHGNQIADAIVQGP
jgi:hypothetical protein